MRDWFFWAPMAAMAIVPNLGRAAERAQAQTMAAFGATEAPRESVSNDDATLEREVSLYNVVRLTVARNPGVREARERARAEQERARVAGRLPDPELKYEHWGVPMARPLAFGDADTLMLGLRQAFPAWGSLDARENAALAEAGAAAEAWRARIQDLIAEAQRAFYAYYLADREYRTHLQHVEIAQHFVELVRTQYQAGRTTQQDVLRAIVELSKLHNDIAAIEQVRRSSRVRLNTLMARRADAPLGPVPDFDVRAEEKTLADLEALLESRPEIARARQALSQSEAERRAAVREGRWPTVMVGADYMLMPNAETRHGYGAMVSLSLPWLNARHREEVRATERAIAAERSALEAARLEAVYELRDAFARLQSARESFAILSRDLLPQAEQSFEAAQASFAAGGGDALGVLDALRSYLDVRLERDRAVARLGTSRAELERAAGLPLDETARGDPSPRDPNNEGEAP